MTDDDLFLEAMNQMGVRNHKTGAIPKGQTKQKIHPEDQNTTPIQNEQGSPNDRALFLAALNRIPQDPNQDTADNLAIEGPQKLRLLRNRPIDVSDQIDLHGLKAQEARTELANFIRAHYVKGTRCVLIITGKGKNSPTGSILKPTVHSWIQSEGAPFVKSYGTAPRMQGGEGALVVYLKKRDRMTL